MGIFAWQFLVRPVGHFSALSGGIVYLELYNAAGNTHVIADVAGWYG